MGMVIKTNMDSVRTYNIYHRNSIALSDAMYKVSSTQRINSAADGASDLAISEGMRTKIRSLEQADRNAQTGNNMMKTAEGALANISDILSSMREKVMHAANDDVSSSDRGLIQKEIDSLVEQINQNAKIKYNGTELLSTSTTLQFQIGDDINDIVTYTILAMDASALSVAGIDVSAGDASAANGILSTIDAGIATLNEFMANLGSYETQLGYTSDNLLNVTANLKDSESTIRNLDMAQGMTEFMKYNVLTQASQFMLAQAGQNAYSVLNLLQQ